MPLINRKELLGSASTRIFYNEDAKGILKNASADFSESKTYDIFLSHCYQDASVILEVKRLLEKFTYSVYVDWIEDQQLDRSRVNKETAKILKKRMKQCSGLFFVTTENAATSKWMPWELGYFDALKHKVAILPVVENEKSTFAGQEYLSLYPYIDKTESTIWVNNGSGQYLTCKEWLAGKELPVS